MKSLRTMLLSLALVATVIGGARLTAASASATSTPHHLLACVNHS
jgi:hypothetical protein